MDATTRPDAERLRETATALVQRLLSGRLRRGGISTSRPDWYLQCAADAPQPYSGGVQVRVRTWRHWSDAQVQFDADSGEVLHRRIDRLADPPTESELTRAEAVSIAAAAVVLPPDARLATYRHEQFAPGHTVACVEWEHIHGGLRVAGDCLRIVLHPRSHRVISLTRRWRDVDTTPRRDQAAPLGSGRPAS